MQYQLFNKWRPYFQTLKDEVFKPDSLRLRDIKRINSLLITASLDYILRKICA